MSDQDIRRECAEFMEKLYNDRVGVVRGTLCENSTANIAEAHRMAARIISRLDSHDMIVKGMLNGR